MASTIVTLVQTLATSLVLTHTSIALRVIVIAASEGILAIRTWAIWEKRQSILVLLCAVFSAALGVSVTLVLRGINGTHVLEIPERGCIKITNNKSQTYLLLPYLVLIFCECVTMSLSAARIFKWRHQISPTARTPLLDTLWNDGLLYFSWLIALGIVNVCLITFHSSIGVRTGGAQLQTAVHSILSSRIILHLATLNSRLQPNQTGTYVSALFTPTTLQLTSERTTGTSGYYDLG